MLIGDSCYDVYHFGVVKRISPEAPVPVFDLTSSETKEGMATNVYNNLVALGCEVHFQTQFTEKKHRYIDSKSKHQLLRVDEKITQEGMDSPAYELINFSKFDAIIISDYGKGFFKRSDYTKLRRDFIGPIFIDTKDPNLEFYHGAFIKINQHEYEKAGEPISLDNLIITYGSEKVTHRNETFYPPKVEAHDVCGAGDTFLAALAYGYLRHPDIEYAIQFAMIAAAVTVKHIGVYAPTLWEIYNHDNKT